MKLAFQSGGAYEIPRPSPRDTRQLETQLPTCRFPSRKKEPKTKPASRKLFVFGSYLHLFYYIFLNTVYMIPGKNSIIHFLFPVSAGHVFPPSGIFHAIWASCLDYTETCLHPTASRFFLYTAQAYSPFAQWNVDLTAWCQPFSRLSRSSGSIPQGNSLSICHLPRISSMLSQQPTARPAR